jgi:2-amino-4-hydroxy-6-hydroxymethyldihydropteridine diphosphokinase
MAHVLAQEPGFQDIRMSPLYGSKPVGPVPQLDFVNAVCVFETHLDASTVLRRLTRIEDDHGRRRDVRWGPRILDLDLLCYGEETNNAPELTIPHPQMAERGFVLLPLADLAPDWNHPETGKMLSDMIDAWKGGLADPDEWVWPLNTRRDEKVHS